jgi:hypothetical protein
MDRARHHAEVAAIAFFLLGIATFVIAVMGSVRPLFVGPLHRSTVLLAAAAFISATVGIVMRREWSWYWALAVATGFTTGSLYQLAARERIGVATLVVGLALVVEVARASTWFPKLGFRIGADLEGHATER